MPGASYHCVCFGTVCSVAQRPEFCPPKGGQQMLGRKEEEMIRRIITSISFGLIVFEIAFQKLPFHPKLGWWMTIPAVIVIIAVVIGVIFIEWLPVILVLAVPTIEFVMWGIPEIKISEWTLGLSILGISAICLTFFPWEKLKK